MSMNIQVKRVIEQDLDEIIGWFHSRNIEITPEYLSPTGFIVPSIAAGFVYATDSNFCVFESFISNPNTTADERKIALTAIVSAMIQEAREMGYADAYGFATSSTMIQHGLEQGFKVVDTCTTIVRDLREEAG